MMKSIMRKSKNVLADSRELSIVKTILYKLLKHTFIKMMQSKVIPENREYIMTDFQLMLFQTVLNFQI